MEGDGGAPDDSIVVPSMTACAYAEYDDETHGTHWLLLTTSRRTDSIPATVGRWCAHHLVTGKGDTHAAQF